MAPRFDNFLDGSVGGLGGAMGQYFKWNFSQSPAGISTYNAATSAGLRPSTAFGTSLLTTAGLQYATNEVLKGRDRESKKPTFGADYTWEDQVWDSTVGVILPNQGKIPRTYGDYLNRVKTNRGTDSQVLSQEAYDAWKDAEYNQGGIFRINREGKGSEVVGRDTATVFNRTVTNPLYAYDEAIGKENVDRLTAGLGVAALAGSYGGLNSYAEIAKSGLAPKTGYSFGQTAGIMGGSIARGLGTAAVVYNGITDYAESKKAGDSDFRAGVNAVSSTAGGLYGASAAASAAGTYAAPLLATPFAPAYPFIVGGAAIAGGILGNYATGWASDRVLDVAGEGKSNNSYSNYSNTNSSEPSEDIFARGEKRIGGLVDKYDRENPTGKYAPTYSTPQVDYKDYDYRATKSYADMQNFVKNFNPSNYGGANYDYIGTDYQAPASARSQYNDAQSQYQQFLRGK